MSGFSDPHDKIASIIDKKDLSGVDYKPMDYSPELRKVEDNLRFSDRIKKNPLKEKVHSKKVFNCITFDPAVQVFGNNVWDRSIYTTDFLIDMNLQAGLNQIQKYLKRKHKMDSKSWFLLILLGLGGMAVVFMIFLMMSMGGGA